MLQCKHCTKLKRVQPLMSVLKALVDVDSNHTEQNQPLHACLCENLCFMTHEAPIIMPCQMILSCISLYNKLFDQQRVSTRTQHDVHEFLTDRI